MFSKFQYQIFSDRVYTITVDDWDGEPYSFNVTGAEIEDAMRRDALLERAFESIDD